MNSYGQVAVHATQLFRAGGFNTPREAWDKAAREAFPGSLDSQQKGCPRGAYLGLCEDGLVVGIPTGSYARGSSNKAYALVAVKLLLKDPARAVDGPKPLWLSVMAGVDKQPNSQMDVVLALWEKGLIIGARRA